LKSIATAHWVQRAQSVAMGPERWDGLYV
jgi:hypothetical protein